MRCILGKIRNTPLGEEEDEASGTAWDFLTPLIPPLEAAGLLEPTEALTGLDRCTGTEAMAPPFGLVGGAGPGGGMLMLATENLELEDTSSLPGDLDRAEEVELGSLPEATSFCPIFESGAICDALSVEAMGTVCSDGLWPTC